MLGHTVCELSNLFLVKQELFWLIKENKRVKVSVPLIHLGSFSLWYLLDTYLSRPLRRVPGACACFPVTNDKHKVFFLKSQGQEAVIRCKYVHALGAA